MNKELSLQIFIKLFGNIIPKDKNFNLLVLLKEFETYFISPITGRSYILDTSDNKKTFNKFKNVLKFLSCTIEHDEFHKVYNCVFKFTKYKKTYQQVDINLRYDMSYILTFYYNEKMQRHLQYGGTPTLAHLFLKNNDTCYVIEEHNKDKLDYSEPQSRYFMINDIFYEQFIHEEFNESSLLIFTNYDDKQNIKNIEYFCCGDYNFNIKFANGLYTSKNYKFVGERENITDKLVVYLNASGFNLFDLTKEDLLMSEAYAC